MNRVVEVCTYTIEDILIAKEAGAQRVEICADPHAGGTTPSYGLVQYVVDVVQLDAAVMIRPRGGDFVYSPRNWTSWRGTFAGQPEQGPSVWSSGCSPSPAAWIGQPWVAWLVRLRNGAWR